MQLTYPQTLPSKLRCLGYSKFQLHWQFRYLLTILKLGGFGTFLQAPNGRSVEGLNSELGSCSWPAASCRSEGLPHCWSCSVPHCDTAPGLRDPPCLTAVWQHAVKQWRQMEVLTKHRTTPVLHTDKFQGYYPFISTTVRGQQLIWQSMPMRVSRDTWRSFIPHSDEPVLLDCWLLSSSQWVLHHLNKPK